MTMIEKLIEMENSKLIDEKGNYKMITLEEYEKNRLKNKIQATAMDLSYRDILQAYMTLLEENGSLIERLETQQRNLEHFHKSYAELKAENEKLKEQLEDRWEIVDVEEDEKGDEILKCVQYKYIKRIRE